MDVLVEALDNDAGYRSHLFSLFANENKITITRTCGKSKHHMGLELVTNLEFDVLSGYDPCIHCSWSLWFRESCGGPIGEDNSDKNVG